MVAEVVIVLKARLGGLTWIAEVALVLKARFGDRTWFAEVVIVPKAQLVVVFRVSLELFPLHVTSFNQCGSQGNQLCGE